MSTDGSKVAVLLMNSGDEAAELVLDFVDIPGFAGGKAESRCVWGHKDLGEFDGGLTVNVKSHDAAFLVLEAL